MAICFCFENSDRNEMAISFRFVSKSDHDSNKLDCFTITKKLVSNAMNGLAY